MIFDLSQPCVKAIKSTFGGGWVVPLNGHGWRVLTDYYQEPPTEIAPLGNELGWIVEPQDAGDLAEYLRSENIAWSVE